MGALVSIIVDGVMGAGTPAIPVGPWIAAGILLAASVILAMWGRGQAAEKEKLIADFDRMKSDVKSAKSDEKKHKKKADTRLDGMQGLKKDIASLKKRNHQKDEELKKLREDLKKTRRDAKESTGARPAFADEDVKVTASTPALVKVVKEEPVKVDASQALQEEIDSLAAKLKSTRDSISEIEKEKRNALEDQRKMRRKIDQYRRVDLMAKSQADVLHERLRTMGRQYYDAVSEVAALKGEVIPPKPASESSVGEFKAVDAPKVDAPKKAAKAKKKPASKESKKDVEQSAKKDEAEKKNDVAPEKEGAPALNVESEKAADDSTENRA